MVPNFESLVVTNWSQAVFAASRDLATFRPQLLAALGSSDPEVRSAAIAALYEGDDRDAHDAVVALLDDPAEGVRHEALEYLSQFATTADVPRLFALLAHSSAADFDVTTALRCGSGVAGDVLTGDEAPDERSRAVDHWRGLLESRGLLNKSSAG